MLVYRLVMVLVNVGAARGLGGGEEVQFPSDVELEKQRSGQATAAAGSLNDFFNATSALQPYIIQGSIAFMRVNYQRGFSSQEHTRSVCCSCAHHEVFERDSQLRGSLSNLAGRVLDVPA